MNFNVAVTLTFIKLFQFNCKINIKIVFKFKLKTNSAKFNNFVKEHQYFQQKQQID